MKKNIILSMVGVAAAGLLLTSCSGKPESVTAVVAGPDGQPAAVVVKYAKAVSAESVSADAFQVEGQEIETVFVTDKDITTPPEKPECKGEKPECDSTKAACPEAKAECDKAKAECDGKHADCDGKHADCDGKHADCDGEHKDCKKEAKECEGPKSVDGQFVVIVLKKACAEKPACEGAESDSTKAACPEAKAECDGKHANCDGKHAECDGKHADCDGKHAECDSTKAACPEAKAECDGKHADCDGKHADCDGKHADCEKAEKCPEVAVPDVKVNQVKEIKAADGSALKAWGKAFPATKAVPCFGPKGHKHHHHDGNCPEGKAQCDSTKVCPEAKAK